MANKITTLIEVKVDEAISGMRRFRQSVADADGVANKFRAGASSAFGALKRNAAEFAAVGVGSLLAFGDNIIRAGGAMEAMEVKAKTVFGGQIGVIEDWADKSASAMGLTAREALTAGAAIADLLIPMGFSREAAAKMTTDMLDVAGALSAWSGGKVDAAGVSAIFTKAMLGEREELKSLGISITEADVRARLAKKGQEDLTGAALAQAKAVATQELIYEKSTDAQRAWADGSMDAVKDQNTAKASLSRLSEVMNESLYPVLVNLVPVVADLAEALIPVANTVTKVTTGQIGFATSGEKAASSVRSMKDEIKAAGLDYDEWWVKVRMGTRSIEDLNKALEEGQSRAMREQIDLTDRATNQAEYYRGAIEDVALTEEELTEAEKAAAEAREAATAAQRDATQAAEDRLQAERDLRNELLSQIDAQRAYEAAVDDGESAITEYNEAVAASDATMESVDDAARSAADSLIGQAEAFAKSKGAADGSAESVRYQVDELYRLATALSPDSPLRARLLAYIGELQAIPAEIATRLALNITQGAVTTKGGDAIGGRYVPGGSNARAAGGPVAAGEAYLVGEKGPEILQMGSTGGHVAPNHALGGTTNNTINIYTNADPGSVKAAQRQFMRRNGPGLG